MLSPETYQQYLSILKEELVPAMGCTEPISLAYAAALAREGQKIQSACLDALFAGLTRPEAERFQELLEKVLTSAEVRLKEGGNT